MLAVCLLALNPLVYLLVVEDLPVICHVLKSFYHLLFDSNSHFGLVVVESTSSLFPARWVQLEQEAKLGLRNLTQKDVLTSRKWEYHSSGAAAKG